MLIELPVMANVMIFIFHNNIHDSFNFIHGVQLMLSWQQWLPGRAIAKNQDIIED